MIESLIGNTPLVRLERVVQPGMAEVWVKVEGMNPGGSIKDRTALAMIVDAEQKGWLKRGGIIVEPTTGNTGIGLAQIAAARGYRLILCLPDSISDERKATMRVFGAELVLTDPQRRLAGAIEEAERVRDATGALLLDQFSNPVNPEIHFRTTGPEIWRDMGGRIDAFVYGTGTGGTISGVGNFLKAQDSNVMVVAVEPGRSAVLHGEPTREHRFQGMEPGFIPPNLDRAVIDRVMKAWEEDSAALARRLPREEGMFVGMSTGAMVGAALELAREVGPGGRLVTVAADAGARYLSTPLFRTPRVEAVEESSP